MRLAILLTLSALSAAGPARAVELGTDGTQFTLDGEPAFLLGCSYYAGLGASDATLKRDLDELKRHGFNWVRVWATWAAFDNDVSAVDARTGEPRQRYMERLTRLVDACDERGMVVNVTLSRGNGATGPRRLQGLEPHRRAVEVIVAALAEKQNWYLDLSNERNIQDKRFTSFEDLAVLREIVRRRDPTRLVTASHAGELDKQDVSRYLKQAKVDFISLHRPRNPKSPRETAERTRQVLQWIEETGVVVPLHYDEPFRRGFADWEPKANDYRIDLDAARKNGAAGWCFHNGHQRDGEAGRPRRSFDLRDRTLFEQLDAEEKKFLATLLKDPGAPAGGKKR